MSKTKADKSTIPPRNLNPIEIYYTIILILGDSVLLGGFKIGYEVLSVFGVDDKFVECRSDEDFILYGRHEL